MRIVRIPTEDDAVIEIKSYSSYKGIEDSDITLQPGPTYLISPENPQKKHHRGRLCTYTGYIDDRWGVKAKVRFVDNGRPGRVDPHDLVEQPNSE